MKIIAVTGATGAQGGGVVRAILSDPDSGFGARALTRNPDSEAAKRLAAAGAEVVRADLDDPASLRAAFAGAFGAFCVTSFFEHFSVDKELAQARNMADAAAAAGLKHLVWSTLEDTRRFMDLDDPRMPTLQGKYKVPHFDGKGEADAAFLGSGVPATPLLTTAYFENFLYLGWEPQRLPDGSLAVTLPLGDVKVPFIAAGDIGACAYGIFREGEPHFGKTVGIASEHLGGEELAAGFTEALAEEVRYAPLTFDAYRGLGFPGADDVGNMFQFIHDFHDVFRRTRHPELARRLHAGLLSFRDWLTVNGRSIPRH